MKKTASILLNTAFLLMLAASLQAANITAVNGVTLTPSNPLPGTSVTVNWSYDIDSAFNNPHVMIAVVDQNTFKAGSSSGQTFMIGDGCTGPATQVNGGGCAIGNNVPMGTNPGSKTFNIPTGLTPGQTYYVVVGMKDYNVYANPGLSFDRQNFASFTVPLPAPYINLTKAAEGSSALPNGLVLYSIYYDFGNVNNVVISDVVDPQLTIMTVFNGGSAAGQTITWNFPGYTGTPVSGVVTFLAKVGGAVPANTNISNIATGHSTDPVNSSSNNAVVTVGGVGLTIVKSVAPLAAVAGDTLTYTMAYTSQGQSLVEYQNFDAGLPAGWNSQGTGAWSVVGGYLWQNTGPGVGYPGYIDGNVTVHDAVYITDMRISPLATNTYDAVMRINMDSPTAPLQFWNIRIESDNNRINIDRLGTTLAFTNTPHGMTILADVWYTVKAEVVCGNIRAKVWQRGTTEPVGWDVTTNDPLMNAAAAGYPGYQANDGPASYDNLKVFSLTGATNPRVWDTVPAGTTYIAGSCGACVVTGNVLTWNAAAACGNAGAVSYRVTVNPPGCFAITNTAMIDSDDPPPAVASNNVSTSLSGGACSSPTNTPTPSPSRTATPSATPTQTPLSCPGPGALANAGMETASMSGAGACGSFQGNWYDLSSGCGVGSWVAAPVHGGAHALQVASSTNACGSAYFVQDFCPDISCPAQLCVWVNTSGAGGAGVGGAFVSIEQRDAGGCKIGGAANPSVGNGGLVTGITVGAWTQYCVTVGTAALPYSGAMSKLRLVLGVDSRVQTAWFDDATISQACTTPTFTYTITFTATQTATKTATLTASPTPSPTPSFTQTLTYSSTPTPTASASPTQTFSGTPSRTDSPTQTVTLSATPSSTESDTFTATRTPTESASPSPSSTPTDSFTATKTATESATPTPSFSFTSTRTDSPTVTSTRTASPTPSQSPTFSPSPSITMTFTPSAPFHVNIAIYNSAGEKVADVADAAGVYSIVSSTKPLSPGFDPDQGGMASILLIGPNQVLLWDGKSSDGQLVKGGIYYIKIEVKDPFGKVEAFTEAVNVLRSESPVFVEIYNSAGEMVRSLVAPSGYQSVGLKTSSGAIAPGPQATPVTMTFASGATVDWDGTNSNGEIVQPGVYQIKVRSAKTGLDYAGSVTVIRAAPGNAPDIALEENPHRASKGPFRFKVNGTVSVTQYSGHLYSAAGEKVDNVVTLPGGWLGFSRPLATGIYFLELTIQDQGVTRRLMKKVAILN